MLFLYWSITISAITIGLNIYLLAGLKKIKQLGTLPPIDVQPSVAVVIAVRNEEDDLEKALRSVCDLNYENYRIIVVNDRSTDRTEEILRDLVITHRQIVIKTITELPNNWLGKNNALYQGYLASSDEWLLFTDADVLFHPDALSRAVGYAVKNKLDHLTIFPEVVSRSGMLNSILATFSIMLLLHLKPWNAKKEGSKAFVGIGAFNMIRRDAYEKIGTHAAIKLRPDDDLQLGLMVKTSGLRQDVLAGNGYISLEWYKSLKQFGNGLLKNSFSVSNYNLGKCVLDVITVVISIGLPMPLMFIFGSTFIRLLACIVLLSHIIYMIVTPPNKWWYALMIPFAGLYIGYVVLRAAVINLRQGGIYWRDSFYSLAMLKGESEGVKAKG